MDECNLFIQINVLDYVFEWKRRIVLLSLVCESLNSYPYLF